MKQIRNIVFQFVLLLIVFTAGCVPLARMGNSIGSALTVPVATNTVTQTNFVAVPQVVTTTNTVTQTNSVPIQQIVYHTNLVSVPQVVTTTNVVYEARPAIQNVLDTGKQYAPLIPPPFGTAVQVVLAGASGLLALMVKRRNTANASLSDQLVAVVKGVEEANQPEVKKKIDEAARDLGVSDLLHSTVQKLT